MTQRLLLLLSALLAALLALALTAWWVLPDLLAQDACLDLGGSWQAGPRTSVGSPVMTSSTRITSAAGPAHMPELR